MIRPFCCAAAALCALAAFQPQASAAESTADGGKVTLRYQFQPGQTLRWSVVHRAKVRTTVSNTTQTAETTSMSVKVWRVTQVNPDGTATFEHLVESVDMRQQLSGCREVRYNSATDKKAPPGFQHLAQAVGVPLSMVTLDSRGKVLKRERKSKLEAVAPSEGDITIPLPEEPIAVGQTWSFPHAVEVTGNQGMIVRVKTVQKFTLLSVRNGVATIAVATQILTPIHDPAVESQVVQCAASGTLRFDVEAGRVLSQQMDLDKHVVGFRGDASSVHYVTRFTEELLPEKGRTAATAATVRR